MPIVAFLTFGTFVFVSRLWFYHIKIVIKGLTTYEDLKKIYKGYLIKNPFDKNLNVFKSVMHIICLRKKRTYYKLSDFQEIKIDYKVYTGSYAATLNAFNIDEKSFTDKYPKE